MSMPNASTILACASRGIMEMDLPVIVSGIRSFSNDYDNNHGKNNRNESFLEFILLYKNNKVKLSKKTCIFKEARKGF